MLQQRQDLSLQYSASAWQSIGLGLVEELGIIASQPGVKGVELSSSVVVALGRSGFGLVMIGLNFFTVTKSSFT